uniref:Ubiquitin-like domain-containing protein n=1 Tax=Stegastes partitus TaxID=144197 RepID=A0A3B4Z2F2_9TELE
SEMVFRVIVMGPSGESWFIDLCDTEEQFKTITVLQLKEKIRKHAGIKPELERMRMIFTDKVLSEDSTLLCDYGIRRNVVIHLVLKVPGGGGPLTEKEGGGMGDKDKSQSMERLLKM